MGEMEKKAAVAELVGTFLLVFFGTGAIVVDQLYEGVIGHFGISATFGLVVLAVIYAIGEISGAHLNPAVTWAFYIAKRIEVKKAIWYTLAQILGALLASGLLKVLFPESLTLGETLPSSGVLQSAVVEVVLSFTLMFVIINVATGSKEQGLMAGLAIGLTVWICALVGGPVSGASMNPARSIGPGLVALNLEHLWIYLLAPMVGAILSIYVWKFIKLK